MPLHFALPLEWNYRFEEISGIPLTFHDESNKQPILYTDWYFLNFLE